MNIKQFLALLAWLVLFGGCNARPPVAQPLPPPAQAAPAPLPAPPLVPPPVAQPTPPSVDLNWTDTLSRTAPLGVHIDYIPTPSHELRSARVVWRSDAPLLGALVGLDAAGNVVAVDYRGGGRTEGAFDVFRAELARVARWDVHVLTGIE
jgi:hypothetical protein